MQQQINEKEIKNYLATQFPSAKKWIEQLTQGEYHNCRNNTYYFGSIINAKRQGYGALVADKSLQIGQWQNNLLHGQALEIFRNGNSYEGDYINGKQEGFGRYKWASKDCYYEGHWANGMKQGLGIWVGLTSTYQGSWQFNKVEGKGIQTTCHGDRYEGDFKQNLKHGQGKEYFRNGDFYEGTYANGKPEGKGLYIWSSGCYYEGDFLNGLRHGFGYWQENGRESKFKGSHYKGYYWNDLKCGFGVYTWKSGNFYKGEFFNDKREGQGEMYWTDGSYYKGAWSSGVQHGEGELVFQLIFIKSKYQSEIGVSSGRFENNQIVFEREQLVKSTISNHEPPSMRFQMFKLQSEGSPEPRQSNIIIKPWKTNHMKIPSIKVMPSKLKNSIQTDHSINYQSQKNYNNTQESMRSMRSQTVNQQQQRRIMMSQNQSFRQKNLNEPKKIGLRKLNFN